MEEMAMQRELSLPENYDQKMTPEIARKVAALKATINMHDRGRVIAYGREGQASISKFSDYLLQGVGINEVGEAGELLTRVIEGINGYKDDCDKENSGFFAFLKKQKSKIQTLQAKYKSLSDNIETVVKELKKKDLTLCQLSRNFDTMYNENQSMYEFLTMVIYAGEQALQEEKQKLAAMQKNAEAFGDSMETQRVSDFNNDILRFERRLNDLKLTRTIAIQQAPQIRNIQKSADEISENIKRTIATVIPLWKSQMAIALGMQVVRESLDAVNAVKDVASEMLIANSEVNKQLVLEAAQAAERGTVDINAINLFNQNLIDSLLGSYQIMRRTITSREEGVKQLRTYEAELKDAIVKYTD